MTEAARFVWEHWWPHIWPALIGCGVGQAIAYIKLRARIAEHHLAQDVRVRRLADRVDELAAEVRQGTGKVADDLAGLAETIRAVVRDQRSR